jgi:hypothetical protein
MDETTTMANDAPRDRSSPSHGYCRFSNDNRGTPSNENTIKKQAMDGHF